MLTTLKLLQIGKHFFPDTGGIETVTSTLSEALLREDIVADVLCLSYPGTDYPVLDRRYQVIRAKPDLQLGNKIFSTDYVRTLRRIARDYDAGLLHMPNPLAAAAALAFWRKPLLLLWHADIPQPRLRRLLTPLDRMLIDRADMVIVPTPIHADGSYVAADIAPKSEVAPFPFCKSRLAPPEFHSDRMRRIIKFIGDKQMILAVGRLVPYKGFSVLIDAAAKLPNRVAVVIVGEGGLRPELETMIHKLGLSERVLMAGALDDGELSACYQASTLICLPSITAAEMYGMVQVEAMAHGKPVVSTAIPRSGVSWVNQHDVSGLIVEPGDAEALANALSSVILDKSLHARLCAGAVRLFDDCHDFERSGRRYAEIIRKVVSPPSSPERPILLQGAN